MLEVVEAVQTLANLLFEPHGVHVRLHVQVFHRLGDDDVRQKTRHRLLGAAVGEGGEKFERAEDGAGHGRRDANLHRARGGFDFAGEGQLRDGLLRRIRERAGLRLREFYAVGHDGKSQLQRVRFFVGQGFPEQLRLTELPGPHAEIDARLALAGHADLLLLAFDDGKAFGFKRDVHRLCGFQIVVNQCRDGTLVAFGKETRHCEAENQILPRNGPMDGAADFRVAGDAARRGAPSG